MGKSNPNFLLLTKKYLNNMALNNAILCQFSLRFIHGVTPTLSPRVIPDLSPQLYPKPLFKGILVCVDYFSQYENLVSGLWGGEVC